MAQVLGRLQPQQSSRSEALQSSHLQVANRVQMQVSPSASKLAKTDDTHKPSTSRQYSLLKPNLLKSSHTASWNAQAHSLDQSDSEDEKLTVRLPLPKPKSAKKMAKKRRVSDTSTTSTASNVSAVAAALATLPAQPKKKRGRGSTFTLHEISVNLLIPLITAPKKSSAKKISDTDANVTWHYDYERCESEHCRQPMGDQVSWVCEYLTIAIRSYLY